MKFLIYTFSLLLGFFFQSANAQVATGSWRIFSPNENVIGVEHYKDVIYAAFELGIQIYDVDYKEKALWTNADKLSDFRISAIGKHEQSGTIVIGYDNGNIDLIKEEKIINIPGIKLASITGIKKINSINSNGKYIYVNTGFGIVIIDPSRNEIKDTYYPSSTNESILSSTIFQDTLYALTPTKLLKCKTTNPSISNSSYWRTDDITPIITNPNFSYGRILTWKDELIISKINNGYALDTIKRRTNTDFSNWIDYGGYMELGKMDVREDKFYIMGENFFSIYENWTDQLILLNNYPFGPASGTAVDIHKGKIIIGDKTQGLIIREDDGSLNRIQFEGPRRSEAFRLDWLDGKLILAPGNNSGIAPAYVGIGAGIFENEKWKYVSRDPYWEGKHIWDNGAVAINPKKTTEFAIGTLSMLPLSILSTDGHVIDTFSKYNSQLEEYTSNNMGWYFINDVKYDSKGNLWVLNGNTTSVLKVKDNDGNWAKFNLGYGSINKLGHKLYVDYFDNVWVIMPNNGVIAYKPGDNKLSTSDDKTVHLYSSSYLGEMWPSSNVTALAMDFDNKMWIGTDQGFCILNNAQSIFDKAPGTYTVQRPKTKAQQEGEYEEYRYVLGSVFITDIEVDGGNRKWLGTSSGGAILMSADGQEIIEQFTTDNSPILSNTIIDIEIDHKTGEVFIVTDKGMITYRGNATHEDPEYSDVKIFPNPVTPEFNGVITIQGIMYDSDVKITDIAGNVVFKTTSNGGTATWNGLDFDGQKVATGVYLIWTASNTKKGSFLGKVAIVNQ